MELLEKKGKKKPPQKKKSASFVHLCRNYTFGFLKLYKQFEILCVCVCVCTWVVLRNCVPLGVGNFKLVFEGNLLLQCKYFYFLSLYVDVSDNKNNNDCQSCVLCTLNRTDVAK